MRWEDDEVRMTSLETSEDTRALKTRSVHGGGYVPQERRLIWETERTGSCIAKSSR